MRTLPILKPHKFPFISMHFETLIVAGDDETVNLVIPKGSTFAEVLETIYRQLLAVILKIDERVEQLKEEELFKPTSMLHYMKLVEAAVAETLDTLKAAIEVITSARRPYPQRG